MDASLADFEDLLFVESFIDRDMTLAGPAMGSLQPTALLNELASQVADYKIDFLWLDSVARIFGGNENDRHQVTQFITWLTAAAGAAGIGIIGHPGKGQGSEYSGSTAWEGSVRSRLFLGNKLPVRGSRCTGEESDGLYLCRRNPLATHDWDSDSTKWRSSRRRQRRLSDMAGSLPRTPCCERFESCTAWVFEATPALEAQSFFRG